MLLTGDAPCGFSTHLRLSNPGYLARPQALSADQWLYLRGKPPAGVPAPKKELSCALLFLHRWLPTQARAGAQATWSCQQRPVLWPWRHTLA